MGSELSGGQPGRGASRREWRWVVVEAVALAVYLLMAGYYAIGIPPGQAPDELDHLRYIASIADRGQLPALPGTPPARQPGRMVTPEAQQPPLYYALLAPLWRATGGRHLSLLLGRVMSVFMGLAAVLLTRRAVGMVMPGRRAAVALGTALAATFNTYCYVMGTVNNEALAVLVVAIGVYVAARALVAEEPLRPMLALGAVTGLGLLTKLTASVLLPVLVLVGLALALREPDRAGRLRRTAWLVGGALAVTLVVSGWWFVHNWLVYGEPLVRAHYRPNMLSVWDVMALPGLSAAWSISVLEKIMRTIWRPDWLLHGPKELGMVWVGRMAGVPVKWGSPLPTLLPLIPMVLGAWGIVRLWRRRQTDGRLGRDEKWFVAALAGAGAWLAAGLVWQTLMVDQDVVLFLGRYLPVGMPMLGMLLGLGATGLIPGRPGAPARWRWALALIITLALSAYCVKVTGETLRVQQPAAPATSQGAGT